MLLLTPSQKIRQAESLLSCHLTSDESKSSLWQHVESAQAAIKAGKALDARFRGQDVFLLEICPVKWELGRAGSTMSERPLVYQCSISMLRPPI